jgi:hypothetical protein
MYVLKARCKLDVASVLLPYHVAVLLVHFEGAAVQLYGIRLLRMLNPEGVGGLCILRTAFTPQSALPAVSDMHVTRAST